MAKPGWAVNAHHGWTAVQPVGFQRDCSPVRGVADVVLGMGSSAVNGLSLSKPLAPSDSPALQQRLGRSRHSTWAPPWADAPGPPWSVLVCFLVRSAATSARYYTSKRFGSVMAREQWVREGAIE